MAAVKDDDGAVTISVLVVDDQPPFRMAARAVVKRADGFELVAEAATGEEAIEKVATVHPALVLMDINMPGMNGLDATRHIVESHPETIVFLCSTYERSDLPDDAASSGAAAYVNKEELAPALLRELWERPPGL